MNMHREREIYQNEKISELEALNAELVEALEACEKALQGETEDPEGFNWEAHGLLPFIRTRIAKARQ